MSDQLDELVNGLHIVVGAYTSLTNIGPEYDRRKAAEGRELIERLRNALRAAQERGEAAKIVRTDPVWCTPVELPDGTIAYLHNDAPIPNAENFRLYPNTALAAPVPAAGMKADGKWIQLGSDEFAEYVNSHLHALLLQVAEQEAPAPAAPVDEQTEFEVWLVDRAAWLDKELRNGGNFEHLSARLKEVQYILEKRQAARAQRRGE